MLANPATVADHFVNCIFSKADFFGAIFNVQVILLCSKISSYLNIGIDNPAPPIRSVHHFEEIMYKHINITLLVNEHKFWLKGSPVGRRADFSDGYLKRVDFWRKNLKGAIFKNAMMACADNCRVDFRYADFRGANLQDADLENSDI